MGRSIMALQPNGTATMRRFFQPATNSKTPKRHALPQLPDGMLCNAVPVTLPSDDADDVWIRIVPLGEFPFHHSFPHKVTREHIDEMVANFDRLATEVLIDFDHDSLWYSNSIAAGWISELEARDDGLYCKYPAFTPTGESAVRNREYRYFSPVYYLETNDKAGERMGAQLDSVALTNRPYFNEGEIDAVGNSRSNLTPPDSQSAAHASSDPDEPNDMDREKLIALLGLDESATDEQIDAAYNSRMAPDGADDGDGQEPDAPGAEGAAPQKAANSSGPLTPDGDDPVDARLKALEKAEETRAANAAQASAERLVNQAVEDRKILPKHRTAYLNSAKLDYEATKADLDAIPKGSVKPGRIETPAANSNDGVRRSGLMASVNQAVLEQVDKTLSN